jgi:hypothetical protein
MHYDAISKESFGLNEKPVMHRFLLPRHTRAPPSLEVEADGNLEAQSQECTAHG